MVCSGDITRSLTWHCGKHVYLSMKSHFYKWYRDRFESRYFIIIGVSSTVPLLHTGIFTSPPGGGCEVLFSPCLSVCVCNVCLSVCPANILVFYFSAIRRYIDLKFIQDTYRVVLNSQKNIDLHRSKAKVTGTGHCFLKVQPYHKNWAIETFPFFFH